jgi:dienelactone hydrolase
MGGYLMPTMLFLLFASVVSMCLSVLPSVADITSFRSVVQPAQFTATISGELILPKGRGPFPIIVFMHTCGGLNQSGRQSQRDHAAYFASHGFASFLLDSFRGRKIGRVCEDRSLNHAMVDVRVFDAFNAIIELRKRKDINHENIYLFGQSHGATAGISVARSDGGRPFPDLAFRAVAAFYGSCTGLSLMTNQLRSPLLIVAGDKDTWTPVEHCIWIEKHKGFTGAVLKTKVYPDAYHAFDIPFTQPIFFQHHKLAYNRGATVDSRKLVLEFFAGFLTDDLKGKAPYVSLVRK